MFKIEIECFKAHLRRIGSLLPLVDMFLAPRILYVLGEKQSSIALAYSQLVYTHTVC